MSAADEADGARHRAVGRHHPVRAARRRRGPSSCRGCRHRRLLAPTTRRSRRRRDRRDRPVERRLRGRVDVLESVEVAGAVRETGIAEGIPLARRRRAESRDQRRREPRPRPVPGQRAVQVEAEIVQLRAVRHSSSTEASPADAANDSSVTAVVAARHREREQLRRRLDVLAVLEEQDVSLDLPLHRLCRVSQHARGQMQPDVVEVRAAVHRVGRPGRGSPVQ